MAARLGRGVVTVVPITSNVEKVYPFQVFLTSAASGLDRGAKAQAEQVRPVAVERIGPAVGRLPALALNTLDDALRLHLALSRFLVASGAWNREDNEGAVDMTEAVSTRVYLASVEVLSEVTNGDGKGCSMNRLRKAIGAAVTAVALTATAAGNAAPPLMRLNGVGPVKLGMTRAAAVSTGWLAHRTLGCELASPRPVVFQFNGPKAPTGMRGSASFVGGRLVNIAFRSGVRTRLGIRPGVSTTRAMVRAYRRGGFHVTSVFDPTFRARFVTATRGGLSIAAVASGAVINTIAVPGIEVCE